MSPICKSMGGIYRAKLTPTGAADTPCRRIVTVAIKTDILSNILKQKIQQGEKSDFGGFAFAKGKLLNKNFQSRVGLDIL